MKSIPATRPLVGLLAALCLLLAACGNDDDTALAPATAESTAAHSEEAAPEAADHDHDHDHDHGSDRAGGHHNHAALMEVDYEPVPTIGLRTHLDPASGVNLEVITTGFTLAPERASTDPVDGEGHFHLYVDGVKLRRLYAHWAHVDLKEPGDHEIRVELSANDHSPLAVDGVKLDATAVVTIPGAADSSVSAASTAIEVEVSGGKPVGGVQRHRIDAGDDITIIVNGDTADERHIHGYDLVVGFSPGQPGSITFEADIPGVFEVETHDRGDLVMELQVG